MTVIPVSEVRRYLGIRDAGDQCEDEALSALIQETADEMQNRCEPRHVYKTMPLSFQDGFPVIADEVIPSKDLSRNLSGCAEVILLAATAGAECDRIIRRAECLSMAKAAVAQAAGAALIEAYADEINAQLREQAQQRGLYARPRYSPGYGDLSLEMQKLFARELSMQKSVGISLTESLLMIPSKSVTALIGLGKDMPCIRRTGCEACARREDCAYGRSQK